MKNIHFLEIVAQVFSFIGSQDTQGQIEKRPQMNRFPCMFIDLGHVMHLCMAVVARGNAVGGFSRQDLVGLGLAVSSPLFLETGLQVPAAAAAAEVVGFVGGHIDEVFFAHNRLDHISEVIGNRVTKGFSDQLAGILNRELDLTVFIPV